MAFLPKTLTSRLVVTAVSLVALVSALVAVVTTLAMSQYLTAQKDKTLYEVQQRATRVDGDHPPPGGGRPGGPGGAQRPQSPHTLVVDLDSVTDQGGVFTRDFAVTAINARARNRLATLASDGEPRTVSLNGLGSYRVVVKENDLGETVVVGLPMDDVERSTHSLFLWSSLLTLCGVLLAGLIGRPLVRRQLRPLREVADTAYEVTAIPLGADGQTIETRVAEKNTDPATEVGRVGSALNTLLDHVVSALDARHRSELQVRQFVADASHELRTPLSTIHGYAELSRRTPDDAVALSNAMGKVETEATRMSSLVGDLLLLARLDSGRPLEREEVDLTRVLLEAVTDANVVAPEHHWRLDLPDEPVTATGDEHRLHQVVTNLINNARRHTPAGTTVTVGARPRGAPAEQVTVTVHDDGPGIPDDLAGHVFERFTRGDSSRTRTSGGAGLGLSLVQATTEAHGGAATVESRPGSTTFTLSLP